MTFSFVYSKQVVDTLLTTFIIHTSKRAKTIESIINTELKEVIKWLRMNKLSLNAGKTELIFFHSTKHQLDYDKGLHKV